MDAEGFIPEDILEAVRLIKQLQAKTVVTRQDHELINQAKLKVAYWTCRTENIPASRENLTYVLGSDAQEIMENYDKSLEREGKKDKKDTKERRKSDSSGFWENV